MYMPLSGYLLLILLAVMGVVNAGITMQQGRRLEKLERKT